ncbi:prolyl oligopeptidase family serine peptidase, partial [Neisseria sp. P0014.S004]
HYLGSVGKYWLEEGNAFVLANIRGGGEFGPRWHQAAQGISKHKSVDDLLAVVRDLSERGMSSPKHIGLQGGSNGGLITAAAFVREPQSIGTL